MGDPNYQKYRLDMLSSQILVNITDAPEFYLFQLLEKMTMETKACAVIFFNEMAFTSYIKFAVSLVYIILVYLVYMELTLFHLNLFIWKIKHLLGIIPIEIMIEKVEDVRRLIKELS